MTRDVLDRLKLFTRIEGLEVRRLALNMDQVERYHPPPNPAKVTDARYAGYADLYGEECWELDALDPPTLAALIQDAIDQVRDGQLWNDAVAERDTDRATLLRLSDRWEDVQEWVSGR
jgi:hypothetical protein